MLKYDLDIDPFYVIYALQQSFLVFLFLILQLFLTAVQEGYLLCFSKTAGESQKFPLGIKSNGKNGKKLQDVKSQF